MITVLICAALVATVVLVDAKPWRQPPVPVDTWIRFCEEVLELELAPWQKRVLHAIHEAPALPRSAR